MVYDKKFYSGDLNLKLGYHILILLWELTGVKLKGGKRRKREKRKGNRKWGNEKNRGSPHFL